MGKGEGVGSIALDDRAVAGRCRRQRGADTVEAQVDPGGHEAKVSQEHGGLGAKNDTRDGVGGEEYGREVLDAHTDEAFCDGNGVFRNELLEGDEEAGLDGDAARNGGAAVLDQYNEAQADGCTYSGTVLEVMTYPAR